MKIKNLLLAFVFLGACGRRPEAVLKKRRVQFKEQAEADFYAPSFVRSLEKKPQISLMLRSAMEPHSEVEQEDLSQYDRLIMFLENSLVRHHFKVVDRALYTDKKERDLLQDYPFDYIFEVMSLKDTYHYTGISFYNSHFKHHLKGRQMAVKIIDTQSGEIAALITAEYVPCQSGCKITHDQYKIHQIKKLRNREEGDLLDLGLAESEEGLQMLCDHFSRGLRLKAQNSRIDQNLRPLPSEN